MSASITSGSYPRTAHVATPGSLRRFGTGLWRALCQAGAHRAYPELMRLARLKAHTDPAMARQLREAARSLLKG